MKINVSHVAKLAKLPLSEDEEKKYSEQLSKILDYIEQLNKVDTSEVEPTFNVSSQINIMGEDKTNACLSQQEALTNAPKKTEEFFVTKGVLQNE